MFARDTQQLLGWFFEFVPLSIHRVEIAEEGQRLRYAVAVIQANGVAQCERLRAVSEFGVAERILRQRQEARAEPASAHCGAFAPHR